MWYSAVLVERPGVFSELVRWQGDRCPKFFNHGFELEFFRSARQCIDGVECETSTQQIPEAARLNAKTPTQRYAANLKLTPFVCKGKP